jgi:acetyl-CoA acetyltransferase
MTLTGEDVAIVGVGESALGKVAGKDSLGLCSDALVAALDDSGVSIGELDGLITTDSYVKYHNRHAVQLAQYIGMSTGAKYIDTMTSGSSIAGGQGVHVAAALIRSGTCDVVAVVCGDNLRSATSRDDAVKVMANNYEREYEVPLGPVVPTRYAFIARRFMSEFGLTREQLAWVAVSARSWASLHPNAQMRAPITVDDVINSKPISSPFNLLDCSLVSDGAGALILMSARRAADTRKGGIRVAGYASSYGPPGRQVHDSVTQQNSFTTYGCELSSDRAFQQCGLTPHDVDIAYLYDCFSINVPVMLADIGFKDRSEVGKFIASGGIAPGGELPVNTHGGLLSYCHPGKPGGIFMQVEAVRQLRGETGPRQVSGARTAFVQGHGGHASISASTVLIAG